MESSESEILSFLIDWMQDRINTDYPKTGKEPFEVTEETVPFAVIDSLSGLEFIFDIELEFYSDNVRISKVENPKTTNLKMLATDIYKEINDVR